MMGPKSMNPTRRKLLSRDKKPDAESEFSGSCFIVFPHFYTQVDRDFRFGAIGSPHSHHHQQIRR
jgi:hypothetical protein